MSQAYYKFRRAWQLLLSKYCLESVVVAGEKNWSEAWQLPENNAQRIRWIPESMNALRAWQLLISKKCLGLITAQQGDANGCNG